MTRAHGFPELGRWFAAATLCATLAGGTQARAQTCQRNEDCAQGFGCDLPPLIPACRPGQACEPQHAPPEGRCEPGKYRCRAEHDCPPRLACRLQPANDCAVAIPPARPDPISVDAGTCSASEPEAGECVYRLVECKTSTECRLPYTCVALSKTECTQQDVACAPGESCSLPEPTCTQTTHSYCMPPRVDCTRETNCGPNSVCVELPANVQQHAPALWEGASALCLPYGLALALEGRVEVEAADKSSIEYANASSNPPVFDVSHDIQGDFDHGGCRVSTLDTKSTAATLLLWGCTLLALRRRAQTRR